MPNWDHLKILNKGVKAWNKWRRDNPEIRPDFSEAKLATLNFPRANFSHTNFQRADLGIIDLHEANLAHANLSDAQFGSANLSNTDLSEAMCSDAGFVMANFSGANLVQADLYSANLMGAQLSDTRFNNSYLNLADFTWAELANADFTKAQVDSTIFVGVDLSRVKGIDSIIHAGPSIIDIQTLYRSGGKICEKFLRDAGVPEPLINYLPSLVGARQPLQFFSCFISYSTKNQKFADRLHARMRQAGLRVWFDREDMKGGDYLHTQIDRAIQLHDRLLLVLSEESIQSKWVEREIKRTRKIERAENRRKLFPIRLTDMKTLREWECLDSDTGEDLAEEVRKYHIPDFSNWKNHDAFEAAFARLEKDLRASVR